MTKKWPFLFMQRYMCAYFSTLTGIPIYTPLSETLSNRAPQIIRIFQSQPATNQTIQRLFSQMSTNSEDAAAALLLAMAHFKEKVDLLTDVSIQVLYTTLLSVSVTVLSKNIQA